MSDGPADFDIARSVGPRAANLPAALSSSLELRVDARRLNRYLPVNDGVDIIYQGAKCTEREKNVFC